MYMPVYIKKERKTRSTKQEMFDFLGSDGIRTHDLHVKGSVGQINIAICDAKMLPLDHGDFFIEEA